MEKHWTISGLQALSGPSVRALRRDDIHVVYQPIVDLNRGTVFAEEALVRCKNDVFENPSRLFDQAVKEQAAGRLGRMIREIAVENCPTRRLFLDLHPAELEARWLVRPDDPIGFHDHDVFLEITEAAAFEHHELCLSILAEVRGRTGARLVIDDFGAGYSNILRIVELEPAIVKLDRALITDLHRFPRKLGLVRAVVDLCVQMGAEVVAEGIETRDELRAIQDTGAHYGQGYVLARPAFPIPDVGWPAKDDSIRPRDSRPDREDPVDSFVGPPRAHPTTPP